MPASVKPIPQGFHTVTPSLTIQGAAKAIEFYQKALGAKELMRMAGPDGRIMHAEIQIGDSIVFLSDEYPNMGATKSPQTLGGVTGTLNLYVEDVDQAYQRAIDAGGKTTMPPSDMFWGDRYGQFLDPFGHMWGLATHTQDLSPAEIEERGKQFFAQMAKKTA